MSATTGIAEAAANAVAMPGAGAPMLAVRGVKTYSTVIGTRQAVVVEPIM